MAITALAMTLVEKNVFSFKGKWAVCIWQPSI